MTKCDKCKKQKLILMPCTCGGNYCLKHHVPNSHNCSQILFKKDKNTMSSEPTGEFKKIEKI